MAFAHSASPDVVKMVRTWPNGGAGSASSSADQVPTELFYTDPLTREKIWGYEVTTNYRVTGSSDPLRWFKLLLQNTKTRRPLREEEDVSTLLGGMRVAGLDSFHEPHITPADKTAQMLEHIGIEPVAVVTDFLTSVRELTIASIEQTYDTEWVRNSKIQYILTVPAIWSDSSKEKMIQAAKDAGFGIHRTDFYLVSEPEAAAGAYHYNSILKVYMLIIHPAYTLKAIQPHEINVGQTQISLSFYD